MIFFPKLVEEIDSQFNGQIQVYKLFNKYSLVVDNLTQSGGLLIPIWKKALTRIKNPQPRQGRAEGGQESRIKNCLVLGLGGGTAAKLVHQYWPQATITGIEIDPAMIKLGKKYFKLNRTKNLKIIKGDVFKLFAIGHSLLASKYELILVDIYRGKNYPPQAKTNKFLHQLKKLLAPKGIVIFNRLNWGNNQSDIAHHISKLQKIFPQVKHKKILSNTLVFCSLVK